MNLGPAEIFLILVVALIVFGPKKLPEVGRQVGAALRELRKMQDSVRSELNTVMNPDVSTTSRPVDAPTPAAIEEPDHTSLPAPPPPPESAEPGFEGPPESFS
jgi:sec-independent protein translocase protein TatA